MSTSAEIRTVDNEICEDDEDFEIQITIDPVKQPRVILVEPTTLRLTIEDDDTGEGRWGRDRLCMLFESVLTWDVLQFALSSLHMHC